MAEGNPRSVTGLVVGLVVTGVIALGGAGLAYTTNSENKKLRERVDNVEKALKDAGIMKAGRAKKAAPASPSTPTAPKAHKRPATGAATKPATAPAGAAQTNP